MAAGDLCRVSRKFYYHWFIEGHDNTAIHLTGSPSDKIGASVKISPISEVVQDGEKEVLLAAEPAKAHSIVLRAMQHVGQVGYDLASNNCEHFAKYCAIGYHTSAQVNRAAVVSVMCMAAGASGGVIGLALGAVAGPVSEAVSTYLVHHTQKLRDRPELLCLFILSALFLIVFLQKERQKFILRT